MIRKGVLAAAIVLLVSVNPGASGLEPNTTLFIKDAEYKYYEGSAEFRIETNERVNYVVYELENPYRIIIDPLDTVWCDLDAAASFDKGIVKSITFVRGKGVPEGLSKPYYPFDFVAIELARPYPYNLSENEHIVTLRIGGESNETPLTPQGGVELHSSPSPTPYAERMAASPQRGEGTSPSSLSPEGGEGKGEGAKDELKKEKKMLEKERARLVKEKVNLKKDKKRLEEKEVELRKSAKRKFEPRPVKDFIGSQPPPDYMNKTLSLSECINIATDNSLAITVAKERVKLARLKVNEAFRELFPDFTFILDESSGMISKDHYVGRKLGLEFKQPVFHGGELMGLWEQSKVNLKISEENLNKAKEEVIFNVSKAYYELAKAVNRHGFQKELLGDINADYEVAKKEREFDLIPAIDFLNIESTVNQLRHTLLSYENNLSLARMELNKAMNIDIDAELNTDAQLEFKEIEIDVIKCVELAAKFKPEYRISYLNTEVANLTERIARAQTFPQVDIYAKFLKAGEKMEPTFDSLDNRLKNERILSGTVSLPMGPHTFDYQRKITKLAPTVTTFESDTKANVHSFRLNLFDNLGRATNMQDAFAGYKQALDDLKKAERDIHSDLRQAFYGFKESRIKIDNVLYNIELYKKELDVAKIKKGVNDITFNELIQAKTKLYNERAVYIDALADYFISVARVNKAMGLGGYFN